MPSLRPFRALRYDRGAGDPALLISPPYDVISPEGAARLRARHPRNSVRLDLPEALPGDEPGARYRRAAEDLAAWRADGTLREDPRDAVYVYEQGYHRPAAPDLTVQRGILVALALEAFGQGGILPHERTLGAPKADRLALLRATGANLSPIVGLYRSSAERTDTLLSVLAAGAPDVEACDDDGVRHRLWVVDATGGPLAEPARAALAAAGAAPITIADGHHRYETALAYAAERPAADHVLALLFDTASTDLTILPTHRLVDGEPSGGGLLAAAAPFFEVERLPSPEALVTALGQAPARQRLGLFSRGEAALLYPRAGALARFGPRSAAEVVRGLDVSVLAAALEALLGIGEGATVAGRLSYTKDAGEAIASVLEGTHESAFLLDPTPVAAVLAVAAAGALMPQKSTYFYPKPATGLVFHLPGG